MPAQRVLCENITIKRGKITRRIQFLEDKDGYSVIDQYLKEDRFNPIGYKDVYETSFFLPSVQRNIARNAYIGRLCQCGYEEGNKGDD